MRYKASSIYEAVIAGIESGSYATFGIRDALEWHQAWKAMERGEKECFAKVEVFNRYTNENHEGDEYFLGERKLTDAVLENGMEVFLGKYEKIADRIITEESDAIDGDCLLQCAMFGDVIYG